RFKPADKPLSVEGLLRLHDREDFRGDDAGEEPPSLVFLDSLTEQPVKRRPGLGRVLVSELGVKDVEESGLHHRVVGGRWHGPPSNLLVRGLIRRLARGIPLMVVGLLLEFLGVLLGLLGSSNGPRRSLKKLGSLLPQDLQLRSLAFDLAVKLSCRSFTMLA